jgi:hypothetical protein
MSLRPLLVSGLLAAATAFSSVGTNNAIVARSLSPPSSSRPSASSSALSMVAVDTSEIKNGLTIEIDGDPYKIMGFSIMKQARGAAKTTIKMKNLRRGNTIENTYRSGEKFETAEITRKPSQYTYEDEVREEGEREREGERESRSQLHECRLFLFAVGVCGVGRVGWWVGGSAPPLGMDDRNVPVT